MIKAGVAYLVVAWLIVQVLSIMIPAFNIPYQALSFSIIVMIICFPIWLLINWFYDITEEGIIRIHKEEIETEIVSKKSGRLNRIIIITLSIIIILLLFNTYRLSVGKNATLPLEPPKEVYYKTSVAVMPFEDLSLDKDMKSFAIAMSDEIRNRLFGAVELKVIGKISSSYYRDKEGAFDVIARELEVDYILLGSIRLYGDVLRISPQLIDLSDGSVIWTQTYDRTPKDALQVQDEIASIVAERLEVTLLNEEIREHKLNPEAHDLYLKAKQESEKLQKEGILRADSLIRRSIELDDRFSAAWSLLAYLTYSKSFEYFLVKPEIAIESGMLAAQKAIENDSTNVMAYIWQSKFSWQMKDVNQAASFIQKALDIAPNDPRVLEQAGNFSLYLNKIDEAEIYFEKSIILEPRRLANYRMVFVKWVQGNMDEALKYLEKVYDYGLPDHLKTYEMALIHRDRGDMDKAVLWMEKVEDPYLRMLSECSIQYTLGNETEANTIMQQIKTASFEEMGTETINSNPEHNYEIACLHSYMNQADSAFVYLDRAYEHVLNWPDNFFHNARLQ